MTSRASEKGALFKYSHFEAEVIQHISLFVNLNQIIEKMRRQYVHLSVDTDTAVQVGRRRDSEPVILKIDAAKAYSDGVKFYKGNDKVVLADYIPPEYISM